MPPGRPHRGNHSVHQLYVHLVFVVKWRDSRLSADEEHKYFAIFDGICRDERLNCQLLSMGTDDNHVHLLVRFVPTLSISELVKFLKGGFSYQLNKQSRDDADGDASKSRKPFAWSSGYFVKSVGQSTMGQTAGYIAGQGRKKQADLGGSENKAA